MWAEANRVLRQALQTYRRQQLCVFGFGADELDQVQLASELLSGALELGRVEALNEYGVVRTGITECRELGQQQSRQVHALAAVPFGLLDLGVDAHGAAHRLVQALNEAQLVSQRRDAEDARIARKASRIFGRRAARQTTLEHAQRRKLREIEVDDVMAAVASLPPGETLRHVADVVEIKIVQDDERTVARGDDVLLEEIGTEAIGQRFRRKRVLGQITAGTAVRNDDGGPRHDA